MGCPVQYMYGIGYLYTSLGFMDCCKYVGTQHINIQRHIKCGSFPGKIKCYAKFR